MEKIIIIGSSNVDIIARFHKNYQKHDSNPSDIMISWGGVGRNICENLARLNTNPSFMTVLGDDIFSEELRKSFKELKIDYRFSKIVKGQSSIYLALINPNGLLEVASSSTGLIEMLSRKDILLQKDYLNEFDYIVLDTNLSEEALTCIFDVIKKPIIVDATSAQKAIKLKPFLNKIALLKCNQYEALALTNNNSIEMQVKILNELGIKEVIITQGANEIYYNDKKKIMKKEVAKVKSVIDETGAGDAFTSGIVYGKIKGYSLLKSITIAERLAQETLKVVGAINQLTSDEWHKILTK